MAKLRKFQGEVIFLAALGGPVAVAAVLVPFRSSFPTAASVLLLVAVVVAVAVGGTRTAGVTATISAVVWFDFFLTEPFERFQITHRPDIETAICLFVVGVAITELAARNRTHRLQAVDESEFVGMIYDLSERVASGAPATEILPVACQELQLLLTLRSAHFEAGGGPEHVMHLEHDGHVNIGRARWGVHQMGLPGRELTLEVTGRGRTVGRFVLEPTPGVPIPLQRRLVAVAIADQVGSALTADLQAS